MVGSLPYPNPALVDSRPSAYAGMGLTAENVAEKYSIGRDEQDEFAARSYQKAEAASTGGRFRDQIVPLEVTVQKQTNSNQFEHSTIIFERDEGIRPGTTKESLAELSPVFKANGTVTAGNSSQTSDGAAAVMIMSKEKASDLGLTPLLTFRGYVVEGCAPEYMGVGPAIAIPKLMKMTGIELNDIDLVELNEAFAAQALYCIKELDIDPEIINVNGGAIALGHPLGCTGAKLTTQLAYEMAERKGKYGVISMCVGFGMGAAALFEREKI